MNHDILTLEKIDGIYDILPPVAPPASGFETTLLILIYMASISVIVYFTWKYLFSTRGRAKRNIKKLHLKYSANEINSHDAVYQLCYLLSQGLKINQLGKNTLLPKKIIHNKQEWLDFTKRISTLRYENKEKLNSDVIILFKDSLFWLKMWP